MYGEVKRFGGGGSRDQKYEASSGRGGSVSTILSKAVRGDLIGQDGS